MAVKAVPEGFHTVTPLLVVKGGAKLIDFLKNAFGGEETVGMPLPRLCTPKSKSVTQS